jgi:hypothetical protein
MVLIELNASFEPSGGNMNKKIIAVLFILIIIVTSFTGCFGDDKPKPPTGPKYEETTGTYEAETGWIQSEGDLSTDDKGPYLIADGTITIILNASRVLSASIRIMFDDYDPAHSDTDGASPADEVDVEIGGGFNETGSGTTPTAVTFDIMANVTEDGEPGSLPSEISFDVHAVCYCETTYPMTGRPSAILLATRDQGVAYEISASYLYLEEQE